MSRLVFIEVRRNAMIPLLPVLAVVLCLTPIAQHLRPVALWPDRSADIQGVIQAIGPFTAAAAAWMAARERRRDMADLTASTPAAPWRRVFATWAATCGVAAGFYACFGLVYAVITSAQATWGHLIIWPALSGLAALVACSVLGFTAGRLVPGRATPPLAAVGVFAAMAAGMATALHDGERGAGLLSPIFPGTGLHATVFYAVRPDLAYLQIGCYLGAAAVLAGLVVLRVHAGDRAVLRAGGALAAAGLALAAAAFAALGTGHYDARGLVVPLLHDAASDRRVPYTPVCVHGGTMPVCLHPAYARSNELDFFDTTVNEIAAPLAGTPGLPVRAAQSPDANIGEPAVRVAGRPPVLFLPDEIVQGTSIPPGPAATILYTQLALALVTPPGEELAADKSCRCAEAVPATRALATPAQDAVALYLLDRAGLPASSGLISRDTAVVSAARRLAALTPAARHAWFLASIAAVRSGALTLRELP
jgi:hypothetical protein